MAQKDIKGMLGGDGLLLAILNILVGLIMLAWGTGSIGFIFWIAGILYIVLGVVLFATGEADVKALVINIIIGIVVIVLGMFLGNIIVGIILIASALPALMGSSNVIADKFGMKPIETGNALLNKIITIALLVCGICLIAALFIDVGGIADILIRVGGAVLLVTGVIALVKALK